MATISINLRSVMIGTVLATSLIAVARTGAAQGPARPDPAKIKAAVEDLERERQLRAQEELERLRLRRVDLASKAQYARQWILSNYDFDAYSVIRELPTALLDPKQAATKGSKKATEESLARLQKQRTRIVERIARERLGENAMLGSLLGRDSKMNGAIANGRALNFFMTKLGAAAFDHALYVEVTARTQSLGAPERPASLLDQGSAGTVVLDEKITRHIRYSRGVVGNKETGRLKQGPLDLAWPAFLRRDVFKSYRDAIEKARDKAVKELQSGEPVSNNTADQLLEAVNGLMKRVNEEKRKRLEVAPGEEINSWFLAQRHAKLLMGGAYQFIEARQADDVVSETFKTGTIEELIAFMYRNNLQFAPADANGQSAYKTITEFMIRYFHDLEALRAGVASLGNSKEQEAALVELGLPNPAQSGSQPRVGEEGAKAVLDEFKEFDAKQPNSVQPKGNRPKADPSKSDQPNNNLPKNDQPGAGPAKDQAQKLGAFGPLPAVTMQSRTSSATPVFRSSISNPNRPPPSPIETGAAVSAAPLTRDDLAVGRCLLEARPSQRIKATLTTSMAYPDAVVNDWRIFIPDVPELPGQRDTRTTFVPDGQSFQESSPLERRMILTQITDGSRKVNTVLTIEATLIARRLRPLAAGQSAPEIADLSPQSAQLYTMTSPWLDFETKAFQNWMQTAGLKRNEDESELRFGLRALEYIRQHCDYQWPTQYGTATETALGRKSCCGGLSCLFTAVMRANGIPARMRIGRLAASERAGNQQRHCKSEFFARGIGWVPVETAGAVSYKKVDILNYFGNDAGDHLAMMDDQDLIVQLPYGALWHLSGLQGVVYWAGGTGSFQNTQYSDHWVVQNEPEQ